ncbi:hypothetical protein [Stenotrophomonas sp. S39]|uniref:hypothetical protein n=1 Tax=Stenotrophomonas sp. S39 TaxID=2767451 RepID=UPI00190961EC|nr:hypothetical protein [Stenotrophomonas sp. S39]MBK0054333.1 hypothetical protein [Stenotrophomonas sp. S39]
MAASEVTIEAAYGAIPVQDNAPTYKICAGIDTLHALGDASVYVSFVRSFFRTCMENQLTPTFDDLAVLDHLLEQAQALRRASRVD